MPTDLKEFDDLIAALRDERPTIDPGFARELDTRAAAGFGKPRRRLRLPKVSMAFGVPAVACSAIIALIVVAGVLGGGGSEDTTSSGSTAGESSGTVAAVPKAPTLDEQSSAGGGTAGAVTQEDFRREALPSSGRDSAVTIAPDTDALQPLADTELQRTTRAGTVRGGGPRGRIQEESASMTLVAPGDEIASVGDRIFGVVDQVGGFVVSSSVRATDGSGGGGEFQLRIPTDRLDDGLAQLSQIAHVRERAQGVLDITTERNVSRERLQEARAERVSLLGRLEDATTDTEVAALQAQINNINAAIGSYRADLRRVLRRAQFAVVSVSLVAEGKGNSAIPGDKWTPGDALRDAGRVLEVIAGVLLIIGAVAIPLALLALGYIVSRRFAGRRGRARVLDAV